MTENKAIGPLLLQITSKYQTYQNMLTISCITLGLSTDQGNRLSKTAYKILNSTTEIKQRCLKWWYWKTITVFELSKNNWGLKLWDHPRWRCHCVRHNVCEQRGGVETETPGGRKAALFGRVDQRTGGNPQPPDNSNTGLSSLISHK